MTITVEDLVLEKARLDAREKRLTEREQALSSAPPVRDLVWEEGVRQREASCAAAEATNRELGAQLDAERKELRQQRMDVDAAKKQAEGVRILAEEKLLAAQTLRDEASEFIDQNVERQAGLDARIKDQDARESEWKAKKDAEEVAFLKVRNEIADAAAHAQADIETQKGALEKERARLEAQAAELSRLQVLLEQERSPELDRREAAVAAREAENEATTKTLKALADELAKQRAANEAEAKRLEGMVRGIDERVALVDRREAEAARRENLLENRERALKAKQE